MHEAITQREVRVSLNRAARRGSDQRERRSSIFLTVSENSNAVNGF